MRPGAAVLCVLALAVAGSALAAPPRLVLRRPKDSGYQVLLPSNWKFRDASYLSDHTIHFWTSPFNGHETLKVVIAACVGCITKNWDGKTPAPENALPRGTVVTSRFGRWRLGFLAWTRGNPYPDRGWVFVLHNGRQVYGSVVVQLWLPKSDQLVGTRILRSFKVR